MIVEGGDPLPYLCCSVYRAVGKINDGFQPMRHEERVGVIVPVMTVVCPDRRKVEVGPVIEVCIIHT